MPSIKKIILMSIQAVLPVVLVIILMQFMLAKVPQELFLRFLGGTVMTIAGLILFLLGLHLGLLPLGEHFGAMLSRTGRLWVVLACAVFIGYAVTVAEPSVRVLAGQAAAVSGDSISKNALIHTIGLGVAIFMGLAVLRMIKGISLKLILSISYALVFILTIFAGDNFIPLSYDAGGVTTGAITVPFILALGMGMAFVLRAKDASSESFGMVALASVGPILAILLLGAFLK